MRSKLREVVDRLDRARERWRVSRWKALLPAERGEERLAKERKEEEKKEMSGFFQVADGLTK